MFASVLIANRGEIALRIARTARAMGIKSIAVYSDADRDAAHVGAADLAVPIGGARAGESYLDGAKILAAAAKTGAAAIHPGYGFLSENADFASAVDKAALIFIGPPAEVIRAMGDKAVAKKIAVEAGLPVVPGYHGGGQSDRIFARAAAEIGFPVLVKAVAGGGGRGMRVVATENELVSALAAARREAEAGFGDGRLILERYLDRPRHIEVQVFADGREEAVHLGTRDCSMQRRHQKIIEEAPAPHLPANTERAMTAASLALVRAVGYRGAGTVEFVVDRAGAFYFIEMNTRLQVEHPVTEAVTGEDLVVWQFRVAAGEALPKSQRQIKFTGHAIEARLYAEDPAKDFLPAPGRLDHLALPTQDADLRVDSGVAGGDQISIHYDPLIAKIVARGATREKALARLRGALAETRIVGPATNLQYLARLVAGRAMAGGRYDTGTVTARHAELTAPPRRPAASLLAAAAVAALRALDAGTRVPRDRHSPWVADKSGWRLSGGRPRVIVLEYQGLEIETAILTEAAGAWAVRAPGRDKIMNIHVTGSDSVYLSAGRRVELATVRTARGLQLFVAGLVGPLTLVDPLRPPRRAAAAAVGEGALVAPMPGRITKVAVKPGDRVAAGTLLMVVEAMKMEHGVTAHQAGLVSQVHYKKGDQVAKGATLVRLE